MNIASIKKRLEGLLRGIRQKISDEEGLFQRGRFTPIKAGQEALSSWAERNPQQARRIVQVPQQVKQEVNNMLRSIEKDALRMQQARQRGEPLPFFTVTQSIPQEILQKKIQPYIESEKFLGGYFKPSPEGVRIRDVVREMPRTILGLITPSEEAKAGARKFFAGKPMTEEEKKAVAREEMFGMMGLATPIKVKGAEKVKIPIKTTVKKETTTPPLSPIAETIGGGEASKVKVGGFPEPKIPKGMKERGVMETIRTSPATPEEFKEAVEKITGETRFYKPYSDIAALEDAKKIIQTEGFEKAKERVLKGEHSKTTVSLGEVLISQSLKEGRIDEATEIMKDLSVKATRAGQASQAWSMWSRWTPQGMLRFGMREVEKAAEKMGGVTKTIRKFLGMKPPELTAKDKKIIVDLMTKANQAVNEEEKAKYARLAMQTIADKVPLGVSDVLDAYRYNNMLSGLITHFKNFFWNTYNAFITPALTMTAEGRPREALIYELNAIKNIPKGLDAFVRSMRRQIPIDLGKADIAIDAMKYKRLPRPMTFFSDLMEASDKLFSGIIESSLIAAGKTPEQARKLAEEYLVRTPLETRGHGVLSDFIRKIGDGIKSFGEKFKPVRWAVPFLRTPFDAAIMQVEYSPFGLANLIGSQDKRRVMAKLLLGSAAAFIGAKKAMQGEVTWSVPSDPKEKELFHARKIRPFSVKIGDRWVPTQYFGPFAFALLLPAAAKYYYEEAPDALSSGDLEKLGKTISSVLYYWSQSTPLAGLGGFVRTLEGDIDYSVARNLGFTASQVIPFSGLFRYITNVFDPVYRKSKGFTEQLMTNIPLLSRQLEPYTEPTGEPARRDITNYILPWAIGKETPESKIYEPLYRERQEERRKIRLINTLKKQVEEGKPISEAEAALLYKEEGEKTGEPLQTIVETKKLRAKYDKADDLFELYLKADDEKIRNKIEANIGTMGVDFNEGLYNYISKQETSVKEDYVKAFIEGKSEEEVWDILTSFRKEGIASRKAILTNGIIDNLVDEEIISYETGKELKKIVWDRKEKKIKEKPQAKKPKKIRVGEPPKIRVTKARAPSTVPIKIPIKISEPLKVRLNQPAKKRRTQIDYKKMLQQYRAISP